VVCAIGRSKYGVYILSLRSTIARWIGAPIKRENFQCFSVSPAAITNMICGPAPGLRAQWWLWHRRMRVKQKDETTSNTDIQQ